MMWLGAITQPARVPRETSSGTKSFIPTSAGPIEFWAQLGRAIGPGGFAVSSLVCAPSKCWSSEGVNPTWQLGHVPNNLANCGLILETVISRAQLRVGPGHDRQPDCSSMMRRKKKE